ncbi:MAG: endonuclease NucS [Candidatus Bathyarchaeota archaeon]|nr:endonuclease NucS [Candidatus Bathyarchaeota archaeon]
MSLPNSTNAVSSIQTIRLWKIEKESLKEITKSKVGLEARLQSWIISDISIISPDYLVIGREVPTDFGGYIDVLCMTENGDLVIVELKRDKTPREISAQILDYASWVRFLTADKIQEIAEKYCQPSLIEVYQAKFNHDLPSIFNQEHQMLIVGSEIDSSTERIIHYLSETYGVPINALTFNYFKDGENEYAARTFLIEQEKAEIAQISRPSKRTSNLTMEQLQAIAEEKDVNELYYYLVDRLTPLFDYVGTTRSTIAFVGNIQGINKTILSLVPGESNAQDGVKFKVYLKRLLEYFRLSKEEAESILPSNKQPWEYQTSATGEYSGYEGFFNKASEAADFIIELARRK